MEILSNFLLEYRYFVATIVILAAFALFLARGVVRKRKIKGKTNGGSAVPPTPASPGNGNSKVIKIVLVVVGVIAVPLLVVWIWPLQAPSLQSPSPTAVWEWTKNYWLWIVLILGLPFFFLYAVEKPWAKALQWCLATVAALLFVVNPFVDWAWGEKSSPQQARQACPSSRTDVNRCMVTKAGIRVRTESSINPEEFTFCWVRPEGSIIESKWLGPDLLQIKSGGDDFQIEYKWIRKSDLAGGKCPNRF